ncbi:hypothetical protein BFJ72_g15156 [Fusarium proliferatum]|uniref:Uncharacterized protein n=1 Tax=Gibberella intermedia TaxID=948311 RepID=A0A420RRA0_GIBIN|nr:hypothetical protein BFJ72_g15156 [Fusarium proliferatum]
MATPKRSSSNNIPTEEGSFEDWIYLIQGTKELRDSLGAEYPESSLAPLFAFTRERWEFYCSSDLISAWGDDMLSELHDRINASVDNTELLDIFGERISSLQSAASHILNWEGMDVFVWLYGCINGFFPLVKARNQVAWVILAYFCVMLKKAETQWWLQGWADRTMRGIYEQLDDEHRRWVLRPAEELGWIAPRG